MVEADGAARHPLKPASRGQLAAVLGTVVSAVAFAVLRPPVGDLFAARAREAAAENGVGLGYWFSWYGGTVPGHYSVLEPYAAAAVGSVAVGVVAALAVVLLAIPALRGAGHPSAALGLVAAGVALNLWSGRVPFLLGSALALAAVVAVLRRRWVAAVTAAAVTALVTPTCAAFLCLGLAGVVVLDRSRRWPAVAVCLAAAVPVLAVTVVFGSAGTEGWGVVDAVTVVVAAAWFATLPTPPAVRLVAALSVPVCVLVAVVPNALGSNLGRFVWFVLPVMCVATVRRLPDSRRASVAAAAGCLLVLSLAAERTGKDLWVAAQPQSDVAGYAGLVTELRSRGDLTRYRVSAVFDGTHTAAYALLGAAQLARGWETQSERSLAGVLQRSDLDAARYRAWLDDYAVGYVVLSRSTLAANPEDELIRRHRPAYLSLVWQDSRLLLFAVADPTPIAPAPVTVTGVDQATMTVSTGRASSVVLRVRWARWLRVDGGATVTDAGGWTRLTVPRAGSYRLSSAF